MIKAGVLKAWLASIDDESNVAIDKGGLTMVLVGTSQAYIEIGGEPEKEEKKVLRWNYGFTYTWLDDYAGEVNDCDIEHVFSKIAEGYTSGELCTLENDGEMEHRGRWDKI